MTANLLQNATKVYYKMRRFFYLKMRDLLQNATFITKDVDTNVFGKVLTVPLRTIKLFGKYNLKSIVQAWIGMNCHRCDHCTPFLPVMLQVCGEFHTR